MLTINHYKSHYYDFVGYYDAVTGNTYGYNNRYPANFTTIMGKADAVGIVTDPELVEFISDNIEIYLDYKKREKEIKGKEYTEIVEYLKYLSEKFYEAMSKFPKVGTANKIRDDLDNNNFREVDSMLYELSCMDSKLGTLEEFEDKLPSILYLSTLGTEEDLKRYYHHKYPQYHSGIDVENTEVYSLQLNSYLSIEDYLNWIPIRESLEQELEMDDYTEKFDNGLDSLVMRFTISLARDVESLVKNKNILKSVLDVFFEFKDSLTD